jgi:hypothetical protein
MQRFWNTLTGLITSVIVFCSCFSAPADAVVVKDIESCINFCILQLNRYGDIYAYIECIGLCSVYRRGHPVTQYRSGGGLTRSECRNAAKAAFAQDFSYRREFRHWCRLSLH